MHDGSVEYILSRVNVRAGAMFFAIVLAIAGICMVYDGIRGAGSIDFKTVFGEGKLKSGHVGILVLFIGSIICFVCLTVPKEQNTLEITKSGQSLKWAGTSPDLGKEFFEKYFAAGEEKKLPE